MQVFLRTLIMTFMSRLNSLIVRLRILTSPLYWRITGIARLRNAFIKMFSVKPAHPKDYYKIFNWMVSKKLVFAVTIAAGVISLWYLAVMSPLAMSGDGAGKTPTFYYRSLPLKFYKGQARILDKGRQVAYIGAVDAGNAEGQGVVYLKNGSPLYSGQLLASKYEGVGKLYYDDGTLCYEGAFSQNLFHGSGSHYRESGTVDYIGGWAFGLKEGQGELYNAGGNIILKGQFLKDNLVYQQFVGKTTAELSSIYTGRMSTYEYDDEIPEYVGYMEEINAIYAAKSGADSIDGEWKVGEVFVLDKAFRTGGEKIEKMSQISSSLGSPIYEGETYVTLSEAVAMDTLGLPIDLTKTASFEDVYSVSDYERTKEVYIVTYFFEDILYTFFTENERSEGFFMYSLSEKDVL